MWRRHYGEVPFGNIVKHIAELYEVKKTNKVIKLIDQTQEKAAETGKNSSGYPA